MNNYENVIMDLLVGETPKQKYEYLKLLIAQNEPHPIKDRIGQNFTPEKDDIDPLGGHHGC